jgi:hypothetical protein
MILTVGPSLISFRQCNIGRLRWCYSLLFRLYGRYSVQKLFFDTTYHIVTQVDTVLTQLEAFVTHVALFSPEKDTTAE